MGLAILRFSYANDTTLVIPFKKTLPSFLTSNLNSQLYHFNSIKLFKHKALVSTFKTVPLFFRHLSASLEK